MFQVSGFNGRFGLSSTGVCCSRFEISFPKYYSAEIGDAIRCQVGTNLPTGGGRPHPVNATRLGGSDWRLLDPREFLSFWRLDTYWTPKYLQVDIWQIALIHRLLQLAVVLTVIIALLGHDRWANYVEPTGSWGEGEVINNVTLMDQYGENLKIHDFCNHVVLFEHAGFG